MCPLSFKWRLYPHDTAVPSPNCQHVPLPSVDDRLKFSSEQNFLAVDDKQNFSSVDDREDLDTGEDFPFEPIDNVSYDHCDLTQEDKPADDNSQQGYVLPVDITKASQIAITGLPTPIHRYGLKLLTFYRPPVM